MKATFALLLALALGALAANFLLADNGYVMINFRGYLIEMSVPVLLFLLVLSYMAVRAVVRVWRAPRQLGEAMARRRTRKANERMTKGLIALGEGNYARGEKLLTKNIRNSEAPLLNYLAAARAAQAQGDGERRDNWLAMAGEQEPGATATILLTQAELQLDAGDTDAALLTLNKLLTESPRHPEGLRMRAELYAAERDWALLEQELPLLRKHTQVPGTVLDDWTQRALTALFAQARDKQRADELWRQVPKHMRQNSPLIAAHVRALLAVGKTRKTEGLLRGALRKQWSDELALLYSELPEPSAAKLLRQTEKWLREQPESAALLQAAGRLCVRNELWGKARSYYESAVALQPSPQLWHELGQLMLQMGEQDEAFAAFQKGLTQGYGDRSVLRLADESVRAAADKPTGT